MEYYIEVAIRLIIALVLGGLIGIERAGTNHDAGLRTHILVCLGAAGIMVMSQNLVNDYATDVSRIGAQVVSGIGFLGAGCILVNGNKVKGLTTAAGLWTTACVGLATGMGYYFISITMTVLMLLAMLLLRPLANKLQKRGVMKEHTIKVTAKNRQSFETITHCIAENECKVISVSVGDDDSFTIKIAKTTDEIIDALILSLMEHKDIKVVEKI